MEAEQREGEQSAGEGAALPLEHRELCDAQGITQLVLPVFI